MMRLSTSSSFEKTYHALDSSRIFCLPQRAGLSIKEATDASDFGWGGHTLGDNIFLAHEYFSECEAIQSSTYREMLGVTRCLQALCKSAQYDDNNGSVKQGWNNNSLNG